MGAVWVVAVAEFADLDDAAGGAVPGPGLGVGAELGEGAAGCGADAGGVDRPALAAMMEQFPDGRD